MTDRKGLAEAYTPDEIEFIQCLMDRYSENGGIIPLADDHAAFMAIVRRHYIALRSHERMREALEQIVERQTAPLRAPNSARSVDPMTVLIARTALQETDNGNA